MVIYQYGISHLQSDIWQFDRRFAISPRTVSVGRYIHRPSCDHLTGAINLGKLEYFTHLNSSAILGWFPLLTMIIVMSQWGRYNYELILIEPLLVQPIKWYNPRNRGFIVIKIKRITCYGKWMIFIDLPNTWIIPESWCQFSELDIDLWGYLRYWPILVWISGIY